MSIQSALVVDDSKVAHIKLRKLLEKRSISVDWVNSGEDAVTTLESKTPDIVFMDILMPGMDGFETTKAVLSNPKNANLSIVMCSGNSSDEDRRKAEAVGAAGYIGKPYTDDELNGVLEDVSNKLGATAKTEEPTPAPTPSPIPTTVEPAPAAANIDIDAIVAQATAAARQAIEDSLTNLGEQLRVQLREEMTSVADGAGRNAAMEVAADTAATVAENASRETARATTEELLNQRVQQAVASMPHPSGGLDAAAVTTAIRHFVTSDDFKRQVASVLPAPKVDEAHVAALADRSAREVAGQVASQVAETATRDASNAARKVAQDTARIAIQETTAGAGAGTEELVKSAVSGVRTFTTVLAVGLLGVIGYLAYTALA